mgnify:CR=1 FL=1
MSRSEGATGRLGAEKVGPSSVAGGTEELC